MNEDINAVKVAKETITILDYIDKTAFPELGCKSYSHLYTILQQVQWTKVTGAKAHRYIGWAQCAICFYTNTNSNVFRDINRKYVVAV